MNRISDSMFHSRSTACKKPYGAVPAGQAVEFSVYPQRAQGALQVTLWIEEDGCQAESHLLHWCGYQGSHDRYTVTYTPPHPGLYWYYFSVELADGLHYCARGYGGQAELLEAVGDKYQLTVYDGEYHTPRWFGEGITYNIFPDRFCRDKEPEQPEGEGVIPRVLHQNWDDIPVYLPDEHGEILNNDFFGGTLRGVYAKLDYLESLHVTTIYFNPIFQAYSNHRYDTGDYKRIDPLLGCEEDFRALCSEAARRGMRVVLDGVFNHTGYDSRYFNARGHYDSVGAFQSKESPYFSWFDFHNWPNEYGSWWGIYTLPQVNETDGSYQDYIIEDEDSVVRRWLRLGASGWRLDVADELPDSFIQKLNAAARREKSDALIIGEVWEDASNKIAYSERRRYFQGGELDSVMNYPWQKAILRYVRSEDDGTALGDAIRTLAENYPPDVLQTVMNILSTHDTPRAINAILDPRDGDRTDLAQRHFTQEQLREGRQRLKLAAFLQFMLPGMPCIYYGDEAGMTGYRDPFNRKFYPWGREDGNLVSFYRSLARVKKSAPALRSGTVLVLEAGGGRLLLLRQSAEGSVAVCCNQSPEPWTLPHSGTILLGGGIMEYTGETVTLGQGGFCAMERK